MSDEFLTGGESLPAVKFAAVGDIVEGDVVTVTKLVDRDPITGETKKWDDGAPVHVWAFNLSNATGSAAPDPDCTLWVRGNLVKVMREAAREAKVSTLVGCRVKVQHHELGEAKRKGMNPPKLYKVRVTPGVSATVADPF